MEKKPRYHTYFSTELGKIYFFQKYFSFLLDDVAFMQCAPDYPEEKCPEGFFHCLETKICIPNVSQRGKIRPFADVRF